jgi:hypothetical protein
VADPTAPVEVALTIAARPATIFRYFTDRARFTRWMGEASVLDQRVAGWLAAWNEPDPARRAALLGGCLAEGGRFRDPTAAVDGAGQLAEHIGMVQRDAARGQGSAGVVSRGRPLRLGRGRLGPGRPGHRRQRGRDRPGRAVPLAHRLLGPTSRSRRTTRASLNG